MRMDPICKNLWSSVIAFQPETHSQLFSVALKSHFIIPPDLSKSVDLNALQFAVQVGVERFRVRCGCV